MTSAMCAASPANHTALKAMWPTSLDACPPRDSNPDLAGILSTGPLPLGQAGGTCVPMAGLEPATTIVMGNAL